MLKKGGQLSETYKPSVPFPFHTSYSMGKLWLTLTNVTSARVPLPLLSAAAAAVCELNSDVLFYV